MSIRNEILSIGEFDLIKKYLEPRAGNRKDVVLGIGDDAAIVNVPPQHQVVLSIDTLISGVHFPEKTLPEDIGYKSLAVSLSDIAAMGAEPTWVMVTLTMPDANEAWLQSFCEGFFELLNEYSLQLIGGDTTQGPLTISTQVCGLLPEGEGLRRNTARPGDIIYVTGNLGDAGLALAYINDKLDIPNQYRNEILKKLNRPTPRIKEAIALRQVASAAIDISDGLAADLGHILEQSKVGASIQVAGLTIANALKCGCTQEEAWQLALTSGDDYELCFTVPPEKEKDMHTIFESLNCDAHQIGVIETDPGLRVYDKEEQQMDISTNGYQHFQE